MRSRTWRLVQYATPLGLLSLLACSDPAFKSNELPPGSKQTSPQQLNQKADILFVIDNSGSMAPKQKELLDRIPRLLQALDGSAATGSPADYHIGVITSNLGAPGYDDTRCAGGGEKAEMQIRPAPGCTNDPECNALVPTACKQFALKNSGPQGGNFIDYNQFDHSTNIVGGLETSAALTCMLLTGQKGCGLQSPLEAAYRALHDPNPSNRGFLREDALLAVVFVTDKDDCSVPANTDLFLNDPDHFSRYGESNSFRCTRFGVVCNGQLVPYMAASFPGSNCSSAANSNGMGPGKLLDIQRYIDFFSKPAGLGGVKLDPNDVILTAIAAPPTEVKVKMVDRGVTGECPSMVDGETRTDQCATLEHSCVASSDSKIFGDPAVRIWQVISSVPNRNLTPICDTDYGDAIDQLAKSIVSHIGVGCFNAPVVMRTNNHGDQVPECTVFDIIETNRGQQVQKIPSCLESGGSAPCWRLDDKLEQYNTQGCFQSPIPQSCKLPSSCQPVVQAAHLRDDMAISCSGTGRAADPNLCELTSIRIDRGGAQPPDHSYTSVVCTTPANSGK